MTRLLLPLMLVIALSLGCSVEEATPRPKPAKRTKGDTKAVAAAPVEQPAMVAPPEPVVVAPVVVKVETLKPATPKAPMIRISGIRSDKPHASPDKALNDAVQVAQKKLEDALLNLDPPVTAKPSLARIRSDYLKRDSIREIPPTATAKEEWKVNKLDPNRIWVEIDVELTDAQVQRLRSSERVSEGVRGAGLLLALVAAAYGFLRLDAWSKGYLTLWLAIGAALIVALATFSVVR